MPLGGLVLRMPQPANTALEVGLTFGTRERENWLSVGCSRSAVEEAVEEVRVSCAHGRAQGGGTQWNAAAESALRRLGVGHRRPHLLSSPACALYALASETSSEQGIVPVGAD